MWTAEHDLEPKETWQQQCVLSLLNHTPLILVVFGRVATGIAPWLQVEKVCIAAHELNSNRTSDEHAHNPLACHVLAWMRFPQDLVSNQALWSADCVDTKTSCLFGTHQKSNQVTGQVFLPSTFVVWHHSFRMQLSKVSSILTQFLVEDGALPAKQTAHHLPYLSSTYGWVTN